MRMNAEQFVYAKSQISSANLRYDRIHEQLEDFDEDPHGITRSAQYIVLGDIALVDCQICIEMATKGMFPLLGMPYPQTHAISFDEAEDLINIARYADEFDFEDRGKIPRAILLTQFWSTFYTLAKYGQQDFRLSTNDLFDAVDAEYALKHAEFCVDLAHELSEYQKERFVDEHGVTPSTAWRDED